MGNPVIHFEVVGKDVAALSSFYEELFGWKTAAIEGMGYSMVEKEGDGIAGGIGTSQDGSSHVTFYVAVDDPQAALDKAESLGGKTIQPVMTIPDMVTLALFADPEGHVIGLVANETASA
jgi:predicted enzyme related to lactoylglutathione lyase